MIVYTLSLERAVVLVNDRCRMSPSVTCGGVAGYVEKIAPADVAEMCKTCPPTHGPAEAGTARKTPVLPQESGHTTLRLPPSTGGMADCRNRACLFRPTAAAIRSKSRQP